MGAFTRLLKDFFIRDVVFAIGRALVIVGVFYLGGRLSAELKSLEDARASIQLLLAGLAWAVGYAVYDGLGWLVQIPIFVPSYHLEEPRGAFVRRLYERFTRTHWTALPET